MKPVRDPSAHCCGPSISFPLGPLHPIGLCPRTGYLPSRTVPDWFFSLRRIRIAGKSSFFSQSRFRQHFFDNPGRPFMLLDSLLWALFLWVEPSVAFPPPRHSDVHVSAYKRHCSAEAGHLRCLLSPLGSPPVRARPKLMNSAACYRSLLLVMSPIYCHTVPFHTDRIAGNGPHPIATICSESGASSAGFSSSYN